MKNKIHTRSPRSPSKTSQKEKRNSGHSLMKKIIHELNNKLTIVICCASALSRHNHNNALKEEYDKLVQAARETAELGNKINELSLCCEPAQEEQDDKGNVSI